jgi:hypothetical protein
MNAPPPPEPDTPEARLAFWIVIVILIYIGWLVIDNFGRSQIHDVIQQADTPEQAI